MILSGCQLRGLHQHTLDMFVALFGKRGAHHLVGGALFITAKPAVTDGVSNRVRGAHLRVGGALCNTAKPAVTDRLSKRGDTGDPPHLPCPGPRTNRPRS